jgi:PBP1b-binding outer membrane lipoprotein LpoB
MKALNKTAALATLIGGALLLSGCGGDSREAIMEEMLDQFDAITASMKKITDKESAAAQAPKLEAIAAEMKALKERAEKIGKPDDAQDKALQEKYKERMETSMKAMMSEMMRVAMLGPDVQKELDVLEKAMKDMN